MTEKLEQKVQRTLTGICPSCRKESEFEYLGEQERINKPSIQFYNCNSCGSTIDLARIYDKSPIKSSQ